jgi:hypothetical protein
MQVVATGRRKRVILPRLIVWLFPGFQASNVYETIEPLTAVIDRKYACRETAIAGSNWNGQTRAESASSKRVFFRWRVTCDPSKFGLNKVISADKCDISILKRVWNRRISSH